MYLKEKEIFDIGHVLLLILYEVKVFIYCLFSPKFHVLFHANHFLLDLYNTMTKKKSYNIHFANNYISKSNFYQNGKHFYFQYCTLNLINLRKNKVLYIGVFLFYDY
jgi:hypothetical protein